jgi:antitoxin YefM
MEALQSYGIPVRLVVLMDSVSVNRFRDNLKALVDRVISDHAPLKVTRRANEDFVVVSAEDWEREQETLHVLQSTDLMRQIAASLLSHEHGAGYRPSADQLDEISGLRG